MYNLRKCPAVYIPNSSAEGRSERSGEGEGRTYEKEEGEVEVEVERGNWTVNPHQEILDPNE